MNDWNEGYFTATPYTYGYYRELSPTFQKFCLLLRGFDSPPIDRNGRHCELGYGQGVSINIHAAATPGQYIGTDFNPAHAAHANELARASGSGAELFDDSFEQFLDNPGGEKNSLDSIGFHGIWSWISAENQAHIVEFIRRNLKPGGVVYNSYNCFPGWAPNAPLRELFELYDKFVGGNENNTFKRVEDALKFAEDLINAKPIYALRVPEMKAKLDQIKKHDHNYLAHEYFNHEWTCPYFSELCEIISAAKLDYACTAIPLDAVDQLNLTADAQKFLNAIANPIMREQARDYFINQQFRKDLYVRGLRRLPPQERLRRLLDMRFVLQTVDKISMKFMTLVGEFALPEHAFDVMLQYLAEDGYRPKKFDELFRQRRLPMFEFEQMLVLLTNNQTLAPCLDEESSALVKPHCDALNDYLCLRAETRPDVMTLASPVTGEGFMVGRLEQICIARVKRGLKTADELAHEMWKVLEPQGERMIKDGKQLATEEENVAELKSVAQRFLEKQLPILRALQII